MCYAGFLCGPCVTGHLGSAGSNIPLLHLELFKLAFAFQPHTSSPLTDMKCKHIFIYFFLLLSCRMNSIQYKGPGAWTD